MRREFEVILLKDGQVDCPCCGRFAKIYRRKINSTMAATLIKLRRRSGEGYPWLHLRDFITNSIGETGIAKLRYWGLVKESPEDSGIGGKNSGMWQITDTGKDFVDGLSTTKSHAIVLFGDLMRLEGDQVSIRDCLNEKFDYDELMGQRVS